MSLPKEEFTFVAMPQGEAAPASAPEQPVAQPVVQRAEPRAAAPVIAVQQPTVQQPVMQAVPEAPEPGQAPSMAAAPVAEPVAPPVAQPVAQPAEQPVQQPVEQAPVQAEPPVAAAVDQLAATPVGVEQPPVAAAVTEAPAPDLPPAAGEEGVVAEAAAVHHGHDSEINLDEILVHMLEVKASDLHLTENAPPMVRVQGDLQPVPGYGALDSTQLQQAIYAILTDRQKQRFEEDRELDLAYELPGAARFRVNVMQQQGSVGAVLRTIPWDILPLSALRMPEILGDFADLPRGLVLVTGPTGSGKSTTLAAIIDQANRTRHGHILTVEDPIEFVHPHRNCVVNQREVGQDTLSFQGALKHALRQDPDIILVGEMRDLETISIALTAAETGHLVFGTLHTSSAGSTIDRIIDVFPADQQSQIRTQLAGSIQGVVCQTLCKTNDGAGRVAATEVMMATPAVRNLIREGKLMSIPSALQTGAKYGMHTLNQSLAGLVQDGSISYEMAREKASDLAELNQLLGRGTSDASD